MGITKINCNSASVLSSSDIGPILMPLARGESRCPGPTLFGVIGGNNDEESSAQSERAFIKLAETGPRSEDHPLGTVG